MRYALLVALVALMATFAVTGASWGEPRATKAPQAFSSTAVSTKKAQRCPYARIGLAYYRGRFIKWQLARDAMIPSWRKPRNCADARYLAFVWSERARASRKTTMKHLERIRERTLNEQRTWIRAIREAQKAYPGTEWWLRSCSSSEGAGRNLSINYFQMNHQGSGAGGWMQFMHSTWVRMFGLDGYHGAIDDLTARGFIVPKEVHSWYSRTGQALAAAWGLENGRRSEWHGSGC